VNVNSLWDKVGQSISASTLSSPGHTSGDVPHAVFKGVLQVQLGLNNPSVGDVIGMSRVRFLTGDLSEFEL